jgi:hypothetical protein
MGVVLINRDHPVERAKMRTALAFRSGYNLKVRSFFGGYSWRPQQTFKGISILREVLFASYSAVCN